MDLLSLFFALLPIVLVVLLLVWREWSADTSGIVGWGAALIVAVAFFSTPLTVVLKSSLHGIIASFPVSLMVATSIWQINFMESTGALKRIVIFIKTISNSHKAVQVMIINIGFGTLLASVGATPVSILPPIMIALGYSTFVAIALPAIGFDALCTYALLGAPLVVFSDLTGTSLSEAGTVFAKFLPIISTLIAFAMLWIIGRLELIKKGFIPTIISGVVIGITAILVNKLGGTATVLTGVIAGITTILAMLIYLKFLGKKIVDDSELTKEEHEYAQSYSLLKAFSPWIILILASLVVNFVPAINNLLFKELAFPISIIPIEKLTIKTRFLWNAYFWILVSTLISMVFLKPTGQQVKESLKKWTKRAPRPTVAAAIFFAIAFIMNFSGYQLESDTWKLINPDNNMIAVLASSTIKGVGNLYPLLAPFLGLFGGFVSGSESSTIATFFKYNAQASKLINAKELYIIAGLAIGGGLASVISPAKLQNAAAAIDAIGQESKVIKTAFVLSILITAAAAVLTYLWAW